MASTDQIIYRGPFKTLPYEQYAAMNGRPPEALRDQLVEVLKEYGRIDIYSRKCSLFDAASELAQTGRAYMREKNGRSYISAYRPLQTAQARIMSMLVINL